MSKKGDFDDDKSNRSLKDKKAAFEKKTTDLSSSTKTGPTTGTQDDMMFAQRVERGAVRETAKTYGQQKAQRDIFQESVQTEFQQAKELGISVEELRKQVKEQRALEQNQRYAKKSDAEKAKEFGMSEKEYQQQLEAMKRFTPKK